MSKQALIIAIMVAMIILWITETLGMQKTSKLLAGGIDLAFAILRWQLTQQSTASFLPCSAFYCLFRIEISPLRRTVRLPSASSTSSPPRLSIATAVAGVISPFFIKLIFSPIIIEWER